MRTARERVVAFCLVISLVIVTQQPATAHTYRNQSHIAATATQQDDKAKDKDKKEEDKKKKKKEEEEKKGTLATFEEEATEPKPATSTHSDDSGDSGGFWVSVGEFALIVFVGGAVGSWYRVTGNPVDEDFEEGWGRREIGEPSIPFVGLNFSYENVESDIEAYDARAEGGFGPFGVHYRFTRFKEKALETELDLSWLHGVLRMSYTRYVEVGLGFGGIFLEGDGSESGGSFALPIRIEPSEYFGFDYRPAWGWINGNTISDHELALRLGVRYLSIRGGYRWTKAGGSTLKGPIVGVLFSL